MRGLCHTERCYARSPLAQHLSLLPILAESFQAVTEKTKQLAPTSNLSHKGGSGINSHTEHQRSISKKHLELFKNFNKSFFEKDFSRFTSHFSLKRCRLMRGEGATHVAHSDNSRKVAFTLAEVLITLGIIGVVAAITMPTLVNNYKTKQLEVRFKVADSIIQQAVKRTLSELGCDEISDIDVSSVEIINQNLSVLNSIWENQFPTAEKDSSGLKYYYQKVYEYGILGDNKSSYFAYKKTNMLPNGVLISDFSYIYEGGKARLGFAFDSNGPYKGPNRLGHDIFYYYDKDYGDRTSLCNPLLGHSEREKGCYQWARKDVNPLDKSKSYWDILFKTKSYWQKNN